jgi:hypothetical protein
MPAPDTKDSPLTADMSVAPEIARLAEAVPLVPDQPAAVPGSPAAVPGGPATAAGGPATAAGSFAAAPPPTLGALARRLRSIAATPERWWGLVRFDRDRPVKVTVEEGASYQAWLVILPPDDAGQGCDCDVATMIAGEATEGTPASEVLRPGVLRVHGQRHGLRGRGTRYSISLHVRASVGNRPAINRKGSAIKT